MSIAYSVHPTQRAGPMLGTQIRRPATAQRGASTAIERDINSLPPDERRQLRHDSSRRVRRLAAQVARAALAQQPDHLQPQWLRRLDRSRLPCATLSYRSAVAAMTGCTTERDRCLGCAWQEYVRGSERIAAPTFRPRTRTRLS